MQKTITALQRNLAPLLIAVLFFTGCGKADITTSSSSESTINGSKTSHKTLTRSHDGVTRRLETTTDVEIQNGQVLTFPKAALITLQENGGPEQRQAELRENAGKLELWIKDKESFRKGSPEEEKWLERFLSDITRK